MKHFVNIIPREERKKAYAQWRNNPPTIKAEDKIMELLLQFVMNDWWKKGGHKKMLKKLV